MLEHRAVIIAATVAKFRELISEYGRNDEQIKQINQRQEILKAEAQRCHGTAELFEFDLITELSKVTTSPTPMAQAMEVQAAPLVAPVVERKPIREFILAAAQEASPRPVRASELRKQLEQQGQVVHEKTVGMTLYRLLKKGHLRREGRDWFLVLKDEKNPGDQPGFFNDTEEEVD